MRRDPWHEPGQAQRIKGRQRRPEIDTTRVESMAEFIYTMTKARKAVGDKVILDDVSMSFFPGAKIGVVGPNGAGKSTILKIMAGLDTPSNGEARLSPGYSVGILLQEPPLNEEKTVLGNVQEGVGEVYEKLTRYNEISEEMTQPDADFDALLEEMGSLQTEIDAADAWDIDSQLEQAMDALQCPPGDAAVTNLSGGERRRVALCKLLLSKPDLLLLDEPDNHLSLSLVTALEEAVPDYPGAVVVASHDRWLRERWTGERLEL
jgi:ATPase subunit of ABC transporter with duplicated ATPase domains